MERKRNVRKQRSKYKRNEIQNEQINLFFRINPHLKKYQEKMHIQKLLPFKKFLVGSFIQERMGVYI